MSLEFRKETVGSVAPQAQPSLLSSTLSSGTGAGPLASGGGGGGTIGRSLSGGGASVGSGTVVTTPGTAGSAGGAGGFATAGGMGSGGGGGIGAALARGGSGASAASAASGGSSSGGGKGAAGVVAAATVAATASAAPAAGAVAASTATAAGHAATSAAPASTSAGAGTAATTAPASAPTATVTTKARGSLGGTHAHQAFTVGQVISGILNNCPWASLGLPAGSPLAASVDASRYDLRIADDDGMPDGDYPSIDAGVAITSVGVDRFVMCDIATDVPVLRVTIPAGAVQLRVCEAGGEAPELNITCYLPLLPPSASVRPLAAGILAATGAVPAAGSSRSDAGGVAAGSTSSVDALATTLGGTTISGPRRESSMSAMGFKHFVVRLRGAPHAAAT